VLDLKSDNYPGSQINIYINIVIKDKLPESTPASSTAESIKDDKSMRQSVMIQGGVFDATFEDGA
jgi:hypothetical protein